eukprot:GHVQ01029113.1.p1 GENE.GHVQ01029113.1~~GHVQ01029113.1.p1  ORF type:complete len:123 (-),score=12.90 GHVQ01029113.1:35-403(-)
MQRLLQPICTHTRLLINLRLPGHIYMRSVLAVFPSVIDALHLVGMHGFAYAYVLVYRSCCYDVVCLISVYACVYVSLRIGYIVLAAHSPLCVCGCNAARMSVSVFVCLFVVMACVVCVRVRV